MKCLICKHGEIQPGTTTITLEHEDTTVVFKNVPAEVCQTCGEAYLDAATTRQLLQYCGRSSTSRGAGRRALVCNSGITAFSSSFCVVVLAG